MGAYSQAHWAKRTVFDIREINHYIHEYWPPDYQVVPEWFGQNADCTNLKQILFREAKQEIMLKQEAKGELYTEYEANIWSLFFFIQQ